MKHADIWSPHSPDEIAATVRECLESDAEDNARFRVGMRALVHLRDSIAANNLPDAQARALLASLREPLEQRARDICGYVYNTITLAEGANDDEWLDLCIRRSAIQILLDDYEATSATSMIDPNDVADADTELRRVGLDLGPVDAELIPAGLPEHWWWRYPPSEARR